jgi:flagellar motility protein MotE (MotC chaperone)
MKKLLIVIPFLFSQLKAMDPGYQFEELKRPANKKNREAASFESSLPKSASESSMKKKDEKTKTKFNVHLNQLQKQNIKELEKDIIFNQNLKKIQEDLISQLDALLNIRKEFKDLIKK